MGDAPIEPGTESGPDTHPLVGRTFVSTDMRGRAPVPGSTVRITFREGGLAAKAGCNTLFGSATWTGGVLAAPMLASTMMACSPELMDQDTWLAELLQSEPSLTLDASTLTLGDGTYGLVLVETDA
jgi:heat shock protein HslJ